MIKMNEEEVKELIAIYEDKERYNTAKRLGKMWHSYRRLQNNWNELKKWLEENESFDDYCNETTFTSVLEKMQELEQGKDE
jgi:hypothetical protein